MAVDLRRDPATRTGAVRRVGDQLGTNPDTLRGWVSQAEIDEGHRPGVRSTEALRIAEPEREVRELRELRRANEILRTAPAFSPRRSPTARSREYRSARRVHRHPTRQVRGQADLRGPHPGRDQERPEHLLRR